jgi:GAF domain-containing protein
MSGYDRESDPFAELGRIVLGDESLDSILTKVASLARAAVTGADDVSVTLVTKGDPQTAASTGELALVLDQVQYADGDGPCLTAARGRDVISVQDTSTDERWPGFASAAHERGVGSSLSVGLPVKEHVIGALNMYAKRPNAFDDESIQLAETFAGHAAVALANASLYASATQLAEQMAEAMRSRAVIEQAKGIIMGATNCDAKRAFDVLVRQSQHENRKLHDVAQELVERKSVGTADGLSRDGSPR